MNLQRGQEGADSGRETDRVSLGSHSKAGALTLSELASPETRGKGWQETEGQVLKILKSNKPISNGFSLYCLVFSLFVFFFLSSSLSHSKDVYL